MRHVVGARGRVPLARATMGNGVLAVVLVVALGSTARADEREQARKNYEDASMHYNLGEYAQALDEFKASYRLVREPALLFNIGQCERQLGDYDGASKAYRAFLREAGDLTDGRRAEVQRLVDMMDQALKEKRAQQPPTGTQPPGEVKAPPAATTPPAATATPLVVAAPPPPEHRRRWVPWVVAGGVVAAVALAVGLGVGLSSSSTSYPAAPSGALVVRW